MKALLLFVSLLIKGIILFERYKFVYDSAIMHPKGCWAFPIDV